MRRSFSIVFVALLLMNVMGYYGVFLGLKMQHDVKMITRLDQDDYSNTETLTIKIPLTIPYASDAKDFERVDGKYEHNGNVYRLVKQKFAQDTLTIVCIKDNREKSINEALSSYVKTFTDHGTPATGGNIQISFIKDYLPENFSVLNLHSGWEADVTKESAPFIITSQYYASIIHPPEAA